MIIVTGGAGFIGSNLVHALNRKGRTDLMVVDNLTAGVKFRNIVDSDIGDYIDKEDFLAKISSGENFGDDIEAVFHLGACSATTNWDGRYMMKNNFEYSKILLHYCLERSIPFLYASSAAVYGIGQTYREGPEYEAPINVYGYSKYLFDQYVRRLLPEIHSQVVGLRYFNVFGPREQHKGAMASVALHCYEQLQQDDAVKLFRGSDGYGDGEQRRDFVYVDDVVDIKLWFLDNPAVSGIFNLGTGASRSFKDLATAVTTRMGHGSIEYIPFPSHLVGSYQSFTEADLTALRAAGYQKEFRTLEESIHIYIDWLAGCSPATAD